MLPGSGWRGDAAQVQGWRGVVMPLFADVRPLAPFGLDIRAELGDPKGEAQRDEMRSLFAEDGLLVVRGLDLTMEEQKELCRTFGPVPDSVYENFYVSN